MGGGLKLRSKRELKRVNELPNDGMKIRYLMDILGRRNIELRFLRKKLWEYKHGLVKVYKM